MTRSNWFFRSTIFDNFNLEHTKVNTWPVGPIIRLLQCQVVYACQGSRSVAPFIFPAKIEVFIFFDLKKKFFYKMGVATYIRLWHSHDDTDTKCSSIFFFMPKFNFLLLFFLNTGRAAAIEICSWHFPGGSDSKHVHGFVSLTQPFKH